MIVLDSSAAVDLLARLEPGDWVADLLAEDSDVHAPHLLDVEVVGTLRKLVLARALPEKRARDALAALADLQVTRYPHLGFVERIWGLRRNVTASDAAFVALAEALNATLVTTDRRLAQAPGIRARVLVPPT